MYNCSNCGQPVGEGERFCANCGENNEHYRLEADTSKIEVRHTMNAVDQLSELTGIDAQTLKDNDGNVPDEFKTNPHDTSSFTSQFTTGKADFDDGFQEMSKKDRKNLLKEQKRQEKEEKKRLKAETKLNKKNKKSRFDEEDF